MKDFLKERLGELGYVIWLPLLLLVVIGVLAVGGLAIQRVVYPWWLSIQRESVEESKSFTDANNNMLETYKLEHGRLDVKIAEADGNETVVSAYEAQQSAIVEKMCRQIATMKRDTVNPSLLQWLKGQGDCQ